MRKAFILLSLLVAFAACEKEVINTPPTDITLTNTSIAENEEAGMLIGTLASIDANADDQAVFSVITGGDYFKVENNQLMSKVSFDFEEKQSYNITVNVSDGNGGAFNKEFSIEIVNQDDNYLIGSWRFDRPDYWYQFTFNEDLTGRRIDADNEVEDFTYTYTNNKVKFITGFNEEVDYKIDGSTLTLFGNQLIKQ